MTFLIVVASMLGYVCGAAFFGLLYANRMKTREPAAHCIGWNDWRSDDPIPCRHQTGTFFGYMLWPVVPPVMLLISWLYDTAKAAGKPRKSPQLSLSAWREKHKEAAHQRELQDLRRQQEIADVQRKLQEAATAEAELELRKASAIARTRAEFGTMDMGTGW